MSAAPEPEEGQHVSLVTGWNQSPATGRLLAITGSAGHVRWETGDDAGKITLNQLDDLVALGASLPGPHVASHDVWGDSLHIAAEEEGFERLGAYDEDEWLFGSPGGFDAEP